jgi:hypothetical protein
VFTAAIAVILASVVVPLVATISVMLWSNFFDVAREYRGRQGRMLSAAEVGYVYLGLLTLVYTEYFAAAVLTPIHLHPPIMLPIMLLRSLQVYSGSVEANMCLLTPIIFQLYISCQSFT